MAGEVSRISASLDSDTPTSLMVVHLLRLLARFPLSWLHCLGALTGRVVDRVSPRFSARVAENLERSGIEPDPARRARLHRRVVAELGKGMLEVAAIWFRPIERAEKLMVAVRGWDIVDAQRARGRGVLLLTPHLGCFEIAALYTARRVPLTILYRPPKLRWLEPLLRSGRAGGLAHLAPTTLGGVRRLLKALKAGEVVGLLPDQVPGVGEGAWAPFFGRPAFTMTLAGRLQQSTGCAVVLVVARRLPGGRGFEMDVELFEGDLAGPDGPANLNAAVEGMIRRCPEQYLWSYNRYKVPAGAPPLPADEAAQ